MIHHILNGQITLSQQDPFDTRTKKELQEELTQQIQGCQAVIVVAGMYSVYSEWIDYEIDEEIRMGKLIIGIRPWRNERIPSKIKNFATVLTGWNSTGLISTFEMLLCK